MSTYSDLGPRMMARPVEVHWAGWRSDTYSLQQAGWELSMDQDYRRNYMRMVIRHQEHGLIGQTNNIPIEHLIAGREPYYLHAPRHVWQMQHMGRTIMVNDIAAYANFKAVDATPYLEMKQPQSLEDLVPFPGVTTRSEMLVLPSASVDDLLREILERQDAERLIYNKDAIQRERFEDGPHTRVHAQIVSLAA